MRLPTPDCTSDMWLLHLRGEYAVAVRVRHGGGLRGVRVIQHTNPKEIKLKNGCQSVLGLYIIAVSSLEAPQGIAAIGPWS